MGGHIRGIMSHSYKEPFIGGVCSAVWARREGNWKCPPRIYGVRNGEPWARRRTLGGEGGRGEFGNSEYEEEKSGFVKSWDDPNISQGMRRKYHIFEVTVVSASGRKNHLDFPTFVFTLPLAQLCCWTIQQVTNTNTNTSTETNARENTKTLKVFTLALTQCWTIQCRTSSTQSTVQLRSYLIFVT